MQLDTNRWLVAWAGFAYDWIITREWRQATLCLLPVFLLAGLGLAVAAGSWSDRGRLAQRYLERGNQEIASWERAWAPADASTTSTASPIADQIPADDVVGSAVDDNQTVAGGGDGSDARSQASKDDGQDAAEGDEELEVPPFAEALFRRVQRLTPSDRSQFVIATTLAQRGAVQQAKTMLAKIAPEKGRGYVPAHAMMAQLLTHELQQQPPPKSRALAASVVHHAEQAKDWDRVPRVVLLAASDLNAMLGNPSQAISLLKLSAERFPEDTFALAQLAQRLKNQQLFDEVRPQAEQLLMGQLSQDADNQQARMRLAALYAMTGELDEADKLLKQVPEESRTPEIQRMLSNLYLARYDASLSVEDGKASVNFQYLDNALRIDPSNPLIAEAVAKLVRMQGPRPPEELVAHLLQRLATGSATAVTHAYIAELYLTRPDFAKAIPHLEQVIERLPTATQYLNNLAYCLAEIHPERCEEALQYSLRSIELSKAEPVSDYFDTLSYVLSRLGRHSEAVTAIETAVEMNPNRADYHVRAAAEYRLLNIDSLALAHEQIVQRLQAPATTPQAETTPETTPEAQPDTKPDTKENAAAEADEPVALTAGQ